MTKHFICEETGERFVKRSQSAIDGAPIIEPTGERFDVRSGNCEVYGREGRQWFVGDGVEPSTHSALCFLKPLSSPTKAAAEAVLDSVSGEIAHQLGAKLNDDQYERGFDSALKCIQAHIDRMKQPAKEKS